MSGCLAHLKCAYMLEKSHRTGMRHVLCHYTREKETHRIRGKNQSTYKLFVGGSLEGKMYCKAPIGQVMEFTERGTGDEQYGCRKDRNCSDQIFFIRLLCEKMTEKKS